MLCAPPLAVRLNSGVRAHMIDLLQVTLATLDESLTELTSAVPAPIRQPFATSFVFRHAEQQPRQVIVQKLVKLVTTLRASLLLSDNGFFHEQALLQRVSDEVCEDIYFVAIPLIGNEPYSRAHDTYLRAFFLEDLDSISGQPINSRRPMVPRSKIRSYIANTPYSGMDSSTQIHNSEFLSNFYSSYVHGASFTIMDQYGGNPPHFHTSGMLGTPLEPIHKRDLLNYFYRAILAFRCATIAIEGTEGTSRLRNISEVYARIPGLM